MIRHGDFGAATVVAFLFAVTPARAAETTYAKATWPSVVRLERRGVDVVAFLGGMYAIDRVQEECHLESTPGPARRALVRSAAGAWRVEEIAPCPPGRHGCHEEADVASLVSEMACDMLARFGWPGKDVGAEVERDGYEWFGSSWYGGEGNFGVGGIGRRRLGDLRVEMRWPAALRESTVTAVEWDGRWLWVGTGFDGEYGRSWSIGLLRYDWDNDVLEEVTRSGDGPCGFLPMALLRVGDELWVGTELGLSILRERDGSWRHFVPDFADARLMRPVTCEALYREIPEGLATALSDADRIVRAQALNFALRWFRPGITGGFGRKTPKGLRR